MSRALLTLVASLASAASCVGCAAGRPAAHAGAQSITSTRFAPDERSDDSRAVAASALVFDPPVTLGEPSLDLARADRQPAAFFGYEEGFVEYYRLTVDDRQIGYGGLGGFGGGGGSWGGRGFGGWGWYDRYERRALSEKVGVIRR